MNMTRRQFRKQKQARLKELNFPDETLEKPVEADPEKIELAFKTWRESFLKQFSWYQVKSAA
jgi:hypothetical protein